MKSECEVLFVDEKIIKKELVEKINPMLILSAALDVGEQMLISGAEVSRIEDSITRICLSYGIMRVDAFSITKVLFVTVHTTDGKILTQARKIRETIKDFYRLEQLNSLSRYICKNTPPVKEIKQQIVKINEDSKQNIWLILFAHILAASIFTLFFGGVLRDIPAAIVVSLSIFLSSRFTRRGGVNRVVYYLLTSLVAGFISIFAVKFGLGVNVDKIMIGNIMLLIPGVAMTSSIWDMLAGDTITGILRMCESLLIASSIAGGFAIATLVSGGLLA